MAVSQAEQPVAAARPAWRRLLPVLALVTVAWLGVQWLTGADDRPRLSEGQAPPLQIVGFDGTPIDLGALRGQGVVVNFWASWCGPCRAEAELFEAAWRTERDSERDNGIVFVGVNRQDTPEAAQAFLHKFAVSYPNGPDTAENWGRRFGVVGLPTTFFIDAQGEIQTVAWGPITSEGELARQLDKIRPRQP